MTKFTFKKPQDWSDPKEFTITKGAQPEPKEALPVPEPVKPVKEVDPNKTIYCFKPTLLQVFLAAIIGLAIGVRDR